MPDLTALLQRHGLPPEERLLVKILAYLWPGDHAGLTACFELCRSRDVPREQAEEMLLQAVLFCGFPRVVNAFRVLNDTWPKATAPTGGGLPVEAQRRAGEDLFASIYGDNTDRVHAMLASFHGELHDFVLEAAYGRILTRPGLPPRVRELAAVGVLALTEQSRQLIAHGRGALRLGADLRQVEEAIFTAIEDEAQTQAWVTRLRE